LLALVHVTADIYCALSVNTTALPVTITSNDDSVMIQQVCMVTSGPIYWSNFMG